MASEGFPKYLLSAKFCYIVRNPGRDVMANVLDTLIKSQTQKGTLSEKLTDLGIYNKFNKKDRQVIDNNDPLENRDITFLYSIILKLYQNRKLPHDKLQNLLKKIKYERNVVSHEDLKLMPQEFDDKLKYFYGVLVDTIHEICILHPDQKDKFDALRVSVDDSFKKIRSEKLRELLDPQKDYLIFKEEQKNFRDQNQQVIQQESRILLMAQLRKHCKTVLFEWISKYEATDPSETFVSIRMQRKKEFHTFMPKENFDEMDWNKIFAVKGRGNADIKVVIISAEAGAGKTTLLRLIAEKWSKEQTDDIPGLDCSLLFYMQFRNSTVKSLDDFICDNLEQVVKSYDFTAVKNAILCSNCTFLADGYDERNASSSALFKDILQIRSDQVKIIVTTRPINTTDVTDLVNKAQNTRVNLHLLGIPEELCHETIPKLVDLHSDGNGNREEMIQELLNAVNNMCPEVKHLLKVPLYNTMIIVLLINNPSLRNSVNTLTSLFLEMKNHKWKRILDKTDFKGKEAHVKKFEDFCMKRALRNHLEQKYELGKEDLTDFKDECNKLDLPFQDIMSSLFSTKFSINALETEHAYCYEHRTDQEFSAALAICKMLKNDDGQYDHIHEGTKGNILYEFVSREAQLLKREGNNTDLWKNMQNTLAFVTGILEKSNANEKFAQQVIELVSLKSDIGEDKVNMNDLLHHLNESGNDDSVSKAIRQRLEKVKVKKWVVTKYLSLIPDLLSKIRRRDIILKLMGDPDISPQAYETIRTLRTSNALECLWLEDDINSKKYSDNVVEAAGPTLKYFGGFLGPKGTTIIPRSTTRLLTKINRQTLQYIAPMIQELHSLECLVLVFEYSELSSHKPLCHLKNPKGKLAIGIDLEGCGGDIAAKEAAQMINELWPRVSRRQTQWAFNPRISEENYRSNDGDWVVVSNCQFTREGVSVFIRTLGMDTLKVIWIHGGAIVDDEDQEYLMREAVNRGFGKLEFV